MMFGCDSFHVRLRFGRDSVSLGLDGKQKMIAKKPKRLVLGPCELIWRGKSDDQSKPNGLFIPDSLLVV